MNIRYIFGVTPKQALIDFMYAINHGFYRKGLKLDQDDICRLKVIKANIDIVLEHFDRKTV